MIETTLTVRHKLGLHARPAALFVQTASRFASKIRVTNVTRQNKTADAKSILGVLTIGVGQNHTITLTADGPDAEAAINSLTDLVESNFGEAESA
jgi:phosphotransferase system HPr (HPr) family protein